MIVFASKMFVQKPQYRLGKSWFIRVSCGSCGGQYSICPAGQACFQKKKKKKKNLLQMNFAPFLDLQMCSYNYNS